MPHILSLIVFYAFTATLAFVLIRYTIRNTHTDKD